MTARSPEVWFAAGARTPFAKVDGPLDKLDAIALSVPIVRHMLGLTLRRAGRIARHRQHLHGWRQGSVVLLEAGQ